MLRLLLSLICLSLGMASTAHATVTCDTKFQKVCIETVVALDGITFYAENRHRLLPVTLNVELDLQNLRRRGGSEGPFVLDGGKRTRLFKLTTVRNAGWNYQYAFSWSRDDITARHDDRYRYRLPFPDGHRVAIGQSCNGRFSHFGLQKYAVDFGMAVGTPVLAAREGRVVAVKEDSNRGGRSQAYEDDGNYVMILHSDRTLAQYYHLQMNGATVRLGQRVKRGQRIGYSGNTGRSTGPHLHFDVVKGTTSVDSQTLPVRFDTSNGEVSCPPTGLRLQSAN